MEFCIDSINGVDTNDGRSPETAWRTLERAHVRTYEPSDKIFR